MQLLSQSEMKGYVMLQGLTIRENTREMAKKGLLVPCSTPMALVSPMTREVWEEGMPPDPTNRVRSHSWFT